MIELPVLSYKHRPESFGNGVYEIDPKRGEIGNQKCGMLRYSQLSHGYKRQKW